MKKQRVLARTLGAATWILLHAIAGEAVAQESAPPPSPAGKRNIIVLSYATAIGLGATHDFAPDFSFLGFGFDWRAPVTQNVWAGLSLDWQILYGKPDTSREEGNTTFTGTVVSHMNVLPLLVTGHYYPKTGREAVRPYGGLGVGAYAAEYRVDVGASLADTQWHFGFAPELGVVLPAGDVGVVIATKFNYGFASGSAPEIVLWNFNVGAEL